ncbi:valine--tRNA ligase [Candidatus Peregrinibacteria bacterium]|nr:valine--tRNA ligase [Candidatus Peregrinibacteria bacterium]
MFEKHFDFQNREKQIYQKWEESGLFSLENARNPDAPVFNITMPPPNANGELHLGHSYGYAVMDTLGRFHRLLGKRVLLLPGKDHAGIQTQVVFERKLRAEGVDVESMPREEFYNKCYDFCLDRANYMRNQEKSLGVSADWDKEIFTLDPEISKTVYETFKNMYEDGLVYKGSRIVHWSVFSQTAISDVEVEYREEKGKLWHIEYPMIDIPEQHFSKEVNTDELNNSTLLKDQNAQFILFSSEDELNNLKIGEIIKNEENSYIIYDIKIITDLDDEENLKAFSEESRFKLIDEIAKSENGITVVLAVPTLEKKGVITVATTRPETMLGDTAIAVHPSDPRYQNYIGKKVKIPIAERTIDIIADDRIDITYGTGAVKVTPAHDFLDYDIGKSHNLEELQVIDKFGKMTDIVPEKYRGMEILKCREELVTDLDQKGVLIKTEDIKHKVPIAERGKDIIEPLISEQWFVDVDKEGNSLKKRALQFVKEGRINIYPKRLEKMFIQWLENLRDWNISRQILWGHRMPVWYKNKGKENEEIYIGTEAPGGEEWQQEEDTFDTWFSSGQWPYTTLHRVGLLSTDKESDHFPTHTMQMGKDILFFWACRMLLFAAYRMNDVPWKNIYFTGLIRDQHGQKMSKSKGNGVEPTDMIAKYGVDALRMSFIAANKPGVDVKFSEKKVEGYSKFVNKLWNASKLVAMKLEEKFDYPDPTSDLYLESSRWIISELNKVNNSSIENIEKYNLAESFEEIYRFTWGTFCSWYLEIIKVQQNEQNKEEINKVLCYVFKQILILLHSFAPFVTEEIYDKMEKFGNNELLASQDLRKLEMNEYTGNILDAFEIISSIREHRKTLDLSFAEDLKIEIGFDLSVEACQLVEKLGKAKLESTDSSISKPLSKGIIKVQTPIERKSDYLEKLKKQLNALEKQIKIDEGRLNSDFVRKAPEVLVQEVRDNHQKNLQAAIIMTKEIEIN